MSDHNPCLLVRTQAAIRWLGTLAPLAALAAGCVFFVPVPTAYHSEGSRRNLTEDTATRFTPGGATVEDVVLALGEPDEADADASRLLYRWERVYMHLFWGWAIPAADATVGQGWERTSSRAHTLRMAFDNRGVLQTVTTKNDKVRVTDPP